MTKRSHSPLSDPDSAALSNVEQDTAEEKDIQDQVDLASAVPQPGKPELEPEEEDSAAALRGRPGGSAKRSSPAGRP